MTRAASVARTGARLALLGGGPVLLRRMVAQQRRDAAFTTPTATGVYAAWLLWAGLLADAAVPGARRHRASSVSTTAGSALVAAGAALFASGTDAFPTAGQVSGTETRSLALILHESPLSV